MFKRLLRTAFWTVAWIPAVLVIGAIAVVSRLARRKPTEHPRVMFGVDPIINNKYWAQCIEGSKTWVLDVYSINRASDFDFILSRWLPALPTMAKTPLAFAAMIVRFDMLVLSFNGAFLGHTPLAAIEPYFFLLAGIKTVAIPYGGDAYVYRRIRSPSLRHALLSSYPSAARQQRRIAAQVDRWERHADIVITGLMSVDGFGRWDCLIPQVLFIDDALWSPSERNSMADGKSGAVVVVHTPNHRGFKGTEFIIDAVKKLRAEGLEVELRLLEKIPNDEVRRVLREDADILVEQLIATGNGLSGFEGMASGLPVICNLEDRDFLQLMRRYTYFGECPLVSASPETIADVLRGLVTDPARRHVLGAAGRAYVNKHQGIEAGTRLFAAIIEKAWHRRQGVDLMTMYHPLLRENDNGT